MKADKDKRVYVRMKKKILLRLNKKKLVFLKSATVGGQVLDISKTGVRLVTNNT